MKEERKEFDETEFLQSRHCTVCEGYYGPNFRQPVCLTCHLYLFPDSVEGVSQRAIVTEAFDSDEDSGNEEPDLPYGQEANNPEASVRRARMRLAGRMASLNLAGRIAAADQKPQPEEVVVDQVVQPVQLVEGIEGPPPSPPAERYASDRFQMDFAAIAKADLEVEGMVPKNEVPLDRRLRERIEELSTGREPDLASDIVENLPPEVLVLIFSFLDDISLWTASKVCQKWRRIIHSTTTSIDWQGHVLRRWPFYEPVFYAADNWFEVYSALLESIPCLYCFHQLHTVATKVPNEGFFRTRMKNEQKALEADPPEGVRAQPLDATLNRWIASVQGPIDSPYMGGVFYLAIHLPPNYPLRPPTVRFLTKIFHPNVSRHGHIGIDCIGVNWSSALTISKVLVSIQSLLTDPFCKVCMEPKIGALYTSDKKAFNRIAVKWTYNFAMHDMLNPVFASTTS